MTAKPECYVGVMPCGCWLAVVSTRCSLKIVARHVAEFVRDGMEIRPATNAEVKKHFKWGGCIHKPKWHKQLELGQ